MTIFHPEIIISHGTEYRLQRAVRYIHLRVYPHTWTKQYKKSLN